MVKYIEQYEQYGVLVFVELKSVVTDSEVLNLSNKIKKIDGSQNRYHSYVAL